MMYTHAGRIGEDQGTIARARARAPTTAAWMRTTTRPLAHLPMSSSILDFCAGVVLALFASCDGEGGPRASRRAWRAAAQAKRAYDTSGRARERARARRDEGLDGPPLAFAVGGARLRQWDRLAVLRA